MKKLILLGILLVLHAAVFSQSRQTATGLLDEISKIGNTENANARKEASDSLWNRLKDNEAIPFTHKDTVVMLYRGEASRVNWAGDMTGWQLQDAYEGEKAGASNIWWVLKTLPEDARLDYKIVLNGDNWILDPANPHQQMSGFGWNSELRMPAWEPSPYIHPVDENQQGSMSENIRISSDELGYDLQYRVYLPADYDTSKTYPVVYVTDGQEYIHKEMGNMPVIMDQLIARQLIEPVIAVFVDPRAPDNPGNNRRGVQYTCNPEYVSFLADELVPLIDASYATNANPEKRCILGTSYGGNNASYTAGMRPEVFGLAAPQSPAYFDATYALYENNASMPIATYMTTGVIYDTQSQAMKMKRILDQKNYDYGYKEVNEGHSWGNWRALLDDVLRYFFATDKQSGWENSATGKKAYLYPTVASPGEYVFLIQPSLAAKGKITMYDLKGHTLKSKRTKGKPKMKIRVPAKINPGMVVVQYMTLQETLQFKLLVR